MSVSIVVSTKNDSFSKAVVSLLKQSPAIGASANVMEVGDELDLAFGAQLLASQGSSAAIVCVGAVVGAEGPALLASIAGSVTSVGIAARIPVLTGVTVFANDLVARRADTRGIADSLASRVQKLIAPGSSGSAPAPARGGGGSSSYGRSAPPPPAPAPAASPGRGGYGVGYSTGASSGRGGGYGGGHSAGGSAGGGYGTTSARYGAGTAPAPAGPTEEVYRGPSRSTADAAGMGVGPILANLRDQLKKHGARGIFGLGRKFRIMDDDGSKSVNFSEFSKALRETGVILDGDQARQLFSYFDHDGSGSLSYDEFLVGVRGELNERRKNLVGMAFKAIDKDGSGVLDLSDIIAAYDASKHPDVIAGRKSKQEIFREFLDNFDGGEKDGKVYPEEFERYYGTISASIDDDDYFELMIRNAWHISGGEGWSANTSCRRVLVTRWDGTKEVVEIKNDLGVGNDLNSIKAALRRQGEDFQSVALYGSMDSTQPARPGASPPSRFTSTPRRTAFSSSITF